MKLKEEEEYYFDVDLSFKELDVTQKHAKN